MDHHGGSDWSPQESAELYRVSHLLNEAGMSVALHIGRSDEGDPWAVFERRETAEVVVHVARTNDMLIVVNLQTRQTYRGRDFRSITNQMLRDSPLSIQQARSSGKVILHPSAIFSAFLVAAIASNVFLHSTQEAKASDEVKVTTAGLSGRDGQSILSMLSRALPRDVNNATMARIVSVGALAAAFIAFDLAHVGGTDVQTSVKDFISGLGTLVSSLDPQDEGHSQTFLDGASVEEKTIMSAVHDVAAPTVAEVTPADVAASLEAALKLIAAVTVSVTDYLDQSGSHAQAAVSAHVADTVAVADDGAVHQAAAPTPAAATEKVASLQIDPSLDHAEVVDILHSIVSLSNLQALGQAVTIVPTEVGSLEVSPTTAVAVAPEAADATAAPTATAPEPADSGTSTVTRSGYVLHQAAPVTQFLDGQVDVYVYNGGDAHIENFKFGEDFIAVGGNTDNTSWIREISFSGNDVKIVGVNGGVLWLDGALAHTT